jgi:hypothetical protein
MIVSTYFLQTGIGRGALIKTQTLSAHYEADDDVAAIEIAIAALVDAFDEIVWQSTIRQMH